MTTKRPSSVKPFCFLKCRSRPSKALGPQMVQVARKVGLYASDERNTSVATLRAVGASRSMPARTLARNRAVAMAS